MSDSSAAVTPTPRWMISFADLLSCILAFFVLIFSMTAPPAKPHNDLKGDSEAAYAGKKTTVITNIKLAQTDQDVPTTYLYNVLKEKIAAYPELKDITLTPSPTQLDVIIDVATFKKSAPQITAVLGAVNNRVEIYSPELDLSAKALEILNRFQLNRKISYFENRNLEHKIDIVIYP